MSRISVMQQLSILRQSGGEIMQNMNANDAPLDIEPLTKADPGELVVCTPRKILLHPAYNGGWKVLRRYREDGRADLTYKHETHGRFRSKKQVLNHLDYLLKKEKESADLAKQCSGSEEEAPPLEYVVMEENNHQEQQPGESEQVPEQLPVCPNHGPSNFVRGDTYYEGYCITCFSPAMDADE